MAEPLKNRFGSDIPPRIAETIVPSYPSFDVHSFVAQSLDGYDDLELTPRARQISDALATHLPADRGTALQVLIDSFETDPKNRASDSMSGFFYMPHGYFIADHGLDHFELAMVANYELTQRFTAEFSIRPFLEHHTDATLRVLRSWCQDPSEHVRRLVSEGTRPRLPWASRLPAFQADPTQVLDLLDILKDDDAEYVRRSVANNLNDIAKDHPDVVVAVAARWWTEERNRQRLIRHGLRTLIKDGNAGALEIIGYSQDSPATISGARFAPATPQIGGSVEITVDVANPSTRATKALIDIRIHFVKANGSTTPKVFKGGEVSLEGGEETAIRKTISLKQHSTRTHYPGTHLVDVLLNGAAHRVGFFELT